VKSFSFWSSLNPCLLTLLVKLYSPFGNALLRTYTFLLKQVGAYFKYSELIKCQ
jgi:hypothetical protein